MGRSFRISYFSYGVLFFSTGSWLIVSDSAAEGPCSADIPSRLPLLATTYCRYNLPRMPPRPCHPDARLIIAQAPWALHRLSLVFLGLVFLVFVLPSSLTDGLFASSRVATSCKSRLVAWREGPLPGPKNSVVWGKCRQTLSARSAERIRPGKPAPVAQEMGSFKYVPTNVPFYAGLGREFWLSTIGGRLISGPTITGRDIFCPVAFVGGHCKNYI